jgi:hypothetical protein
VFGWGEEFCYVIILIKEVFCKPLKGVTKYLVECLKLWNGKLMKCSGTLNSSVVGRVS